MPRIRVDPLTDQHHAEALEIWADARRAVDRAPGPHRRTRLATALGSSPVALLAWYGDRAAGVALAEPFLRDAGADPSTGHVSLVCVTPAYWACGIGAALLRSLQAPPASTDWVALSGWLRDDNRRARRLYTSCGFVDAGDRALLHEGDRIMRLRWPG
jgi:GNAT superfamily N-acetyltransferase